MILYFQYRFHFQYCYHFLDFNYFGIHFFHVNPIFREEFSKLILLDLKELKYDYIVIESIYLFKPRELLFHQFLFAFLAIFICIFTLFFSFRSHTQLVKISLFTSHL